MENVAILTLAALGLGIGVSGLATVVARRPGRRERIGLGLVYVAFMGMIALPLVQGFAPGAFLYYMPLLLVLLLALPPAFYHYITAKTAWTVRAPVPWRDLVLPFMGAAVCVGYWTLPMQTREAMFVAGDLPRGFLPAALALLTFALLTLWLIASFAYLVAILRRLSAYRAHIRQLYSDVEAIDLRWVNVVMALLTLIWAVGAFSLANENYADGAWFIEELFLLLIGGGLLMLNLFAPIALPELKVTVEEEDPDPKYARSALTTEHAAKLASRIEAVMEKDTLYLDPGLSLQKLSQRVGALPNQVSQTLNQEIGETFFDYVARWRVEASKPLITAGDASVLAVAMEVGFNSRSTFYKAFKRETGMTPKDFRAQHKAAA